MYVAFMFYTNGTSIALYSDFPFSFTNYREVKTVFTATNTLHILNPEKQLHCRLWVVYQIFRQTIMVMRQDEMENEMENEMQAISFHAM